MLIEVINDDPHHIILGYQGSTRTVEAVKVRRGQWTITLYQAIHGELTEVSVDHIQAVDRTEIIANLGAMLFKLERDIADEGREDGSGEIDDMV